MTMRGWQNMPSPIPVASMDIADLRTQQTIRRWLNALHVGYLVTTLPPHFAGYRKRIRRRPRLHFLDTSLACYRLGIRDAATLERHPLRGSLNPRVLSIVAAVVLVLLVIAWRGHISVPAGHAAANPGCFDNRRVPIGDTPAQRACQRMLQQGYRRFYQPKTQP